MAETKKEVAKKQSTAVGQVYDYGEDAGGGFENQTREDIAIPFISVLQGLSPQVSKGTVEGARPGMLFNTVTEELYDPKEGLIFVPSYTEHVYVEWVPRKEGGGFVAIHQVNDETVKKAKEEAEEFGKLKIDREGGGQNDLVETFYVYGTLLDEDYEPVSMAVIAFTSTKIKIYRRWNTSLRMFTIKTDDGRKVRPPLFAHTVRITTAEESNSEGDYFNFRLNPAAGNIRESLLEPGHPALEAAKSVADMVKAGEARAAHETQDGGAGQPDGDDIPF